MRLLIYYDISITKKKCGIKPYTAVITEDQIIRNIIKYLKEINIFSKI